jgi:hypothetical protein
MSMSNGMKALVGVCLSGTMVNGYLALSSYFELSDRCSSIEYDARNLLITIRSLEKQISEFEKNKFVPLETSFNTLRKIVESNEEFKSLYGGVKNLSEDLKIKSFKGKDDNKTSFFLELPFDLHKNLPFNLGENCSCQITLTEKDKNDNVVESEVKIWNSKMSQSLPIYTFDPSKTYESWLAMVEVEVVMKVKDSIGIYHTITKNLGTLDSCLKIGKINFEIEELEKKRKEVEVKR